MGVSDARPLKALGAKNARPRKSRLSRGSAAPSKGAGEYWELFVMVQSGHRRD